MKFWGVDVKSGESLKVEPGDGRLLHLSQACLGEVKKDNKSESVCLYLKFGEKKLVLGTLSAERCPQIPFDLVFEQNFELSHNWKSGSVHFTGYNVAAPTNDDYSGDSESEEDLPLVNDNGRNNALVGKPNATKPDSTAAKQVKIVEPNKDSDEDDSSEEESSDESDGEQALIPNGDNESDEGSSDDDEDNDEDESSDEEDTPKKAEPSKKRSTESAQKTPVPNKKAKFVTPQKTDGKKGGGHTATPYPAKQAGKTAASGDQTKQQSAKHPCKSCSRSFTSETGLQAHTKAKHSAAA